MARLYLFAEGRTEQTFADTAPSKRIIDQLPRYEFDKVRVGVQAAQRIGLSRIRDKCPHFSRWVKRLEGLGT